MSHSCCQSAKMQTYCITCSISDPHTHTHTPPRPRGLVFSGLRSSSAPCGKLSSGCFSLSADWQVSALPSFPVRSLLFTSCCNGENLTTFLILINKPVVISQLAEQEVSKQLVGGQVATFDLAQGSTSSPWRSTASRTSEVTYVEILCPV